MQQHGKGDREGHHDRSGPEVSTHGWGFVRHGGQPRAPDEYRRKQAQPGCQRPKRSSARGDAMEDGTSATCGRVIDEPAKLLVMNPHLNSDGSGGGRYRHHSCDLVHLLGSRHRA